MSKFRSLRPLFAAVSILLCAATLPVNGGLPKRHPAIAGYFLFQQDIPAKTVVLKGQGSTPANPSAGWYKLFVDNTGALKLLDSAGGVTTFGAGGGGFELQTETSFTDNSTPAILLKSPADNSTAFLRMVDSADTTLAEIDSSGLGRFYSVEFPDGSDGIVNAISNMLRLQSDGFGWAVDSTGSLRLESADPAIAGVPTSVLYLPVLPSHSGINAGQEYKAFWSNNSPTYTWDQGALATNRFFHLTAPTMAFDGASTVTNAATFAISGPPIAGANATITNPYALWVESGNSKFGNRVTAEEYYSTIGYYISSDSSGFSFGTDVGGSIYYWRATPQGGISLNTALASTSGLPPSFLNFAAAPAHTGITASTEYKAFWDNPSQTYTWAAGALTTNRFFHLTAPTMAFAGASTVTNAATLAISGAPVAGTNATLTNPYAIWVESGTSRFDGNVALGSSNAILLGGASSLGTATRLQLGTPTTANNNVNIHLEPTATTATAIAIQGNSSQTADLFQTFNSSGTKLFFVNSKGVAGGGPTTSITVNAFGYEALNGMSVGGSDITAIGYRAGYSMSGSSSYDTLVGAGAGQSLTTGNYNVAIGSSALFGDQEIGSSVIIGHTALSQATGSYTGTGPVLAIGRNAGTDLTTQNNIAVFGSATSPINNWYFGESYSTSTPSDITFQPSVGSGTNTAGSSFYLKGGAGTGNATPGKLYLQYASAGSSGTTVQSYTTAVQIDSTATDVAGLLQIDRIAGTTSAPSISAGAAAGTTPTVSVTGTDLAGEIVVTTGTGSVGSGTLATITLNTAFANDCYPVLQAADADSQGVVVSITHSSTGFTIVAGAAGWSTSTEYRWTYIVAGR